MICDDFSLRGHSAGPVGRSRDLRVSRSAALSVGNDGVRWETRYTSTEVRKPWKEIRGFECGWLDRYVCGIGTRWIR